VSSEGCEFGRGMRQIGHWSLVRNQSLMHCHRQETDERERETERAIAHTRQVKRLCCGPISYRCVELMAAAQD
jgi:hypothetical protein